jgi:type IV secretory pathway VirB9-like protein
MQQAWEAPNEHLGQGQAAPGLKIIDWTPGSTNVITIREDMLTNIVFPPGETILYRLLSDDSSYEAVIAPDHHSVSIRPIYIGVDADLNIYGASGNLYTFYLRSVPWDSPTLADVNVTVSVPSMGSILSPQNASDPDGTGTSDDGSNDPSAGTSNDPDGSYDSNNAIDGSAYDEDPSARLTLAPRADATKAGVDYAAQALTGNGRIRTDLQILAPSPTDAVIAPIAAWRDDRFTYLDFGPRAASMNEWPVASLVIDNTESPVGTRVAGPNRSIMVIEGIGNISLRDGDHIVCIKANFQNGDPRAPVEDEPYQNNRNSFSTTTNIQQSVAPPPGVTGPSSGDYSGDLQNGAQQPTWPGPSGTQVAAPFKIESGPYTVDIADMLADQIGRGYHDNQPAGANVVTTPPSQVGPEPYPDGIDGATAMVEITAASPVLANQLCQTLQKYDHTCRLY